MTDWVKDPDEVLDFVFDWSAVLEPAETIVGHTVTAEAGITKDSDTADDSTVTVWLSGGTVGRYDIDCTVVTSGGRTYDRTRRLTVQNR